MGSYAADSGPPSLSGDLGVLDGVVCSSPHDRADRLGDVILDRLVVAVGMSEQLLAEVQDLGPEALDGRLEDVVLLLQLPLPLAHDLLLLLGLPAALGGREAIALAPALGCCCCLLLPRLRLRLAAAIVVVVVVYEFGRRRLDRAPFPPRLEIARATGRKIGAFFGFVKEGRVSSLCLKVAVEEIKLFRVYVRVGVVTPLLRKSSVSCRSRSQTDP